MKKHYEKNSRFVAMLVLTLSLTDCVHAKKGCKENHKKINKIRKNNPNFTM